MATSPVNSPLRDIQCVRIDPEIFLDWQGLLDLVLASFAYMNGLVDPPSSALRLTVESLARKARDEIGYMLLSDGKMMACAFFRPEAPACLYIGKLAVLPAAQGRGLGKALLDQAIIEARRLGLPRLRLETRIELAGNHASFGRWGFVKTAEKAHPGFDRTTFIEMQRPVG